MRPADTFRNRIDLIRPDAPDLSPFAGCPVGVRTDATVNPGQIDVTVTTLPRTDRPLVAEVWYPAEAGTVAGTSYATVLRDGVTRVQLGGRACRDAQPADGHFPLVILSHGHPGNRMLLAHLGENLASKGYVVAAVDHADSTYGDALHFGSTLVNRPLDTRFVMDWLAGRHPLAGIVDAQNVAIIGYSMGGYGALVSGGAAVSAAAVSEAAVGMAGWVPGGVLAMHCDPQVDPRLKAIVPIGAWGRQRGIWDARGLAGLRVPALMLAGGADDVSGYATGMRLIFDEAVGVMRHLLTFEAAGHNAAAPIPAPEESWSRSPHLDFVPFDHYADAVWDSVRMNNIAQHFVTAFLGLHLKGDAGMAGYLAPGWRGFAEGGARGLRLETRQPGE